MLFSGYCETFLKELCCCAWFSISNQPCSVRFHCLFSSSSSMSSLQLQCKTICEKKNKSANKNMGNDWRFSIHSFIPLLRWSAQSYTIPWLCVHPKNNKNSFTTTIFVEEKHFCILLPLFYYNILYIRPSFILIMIRKVMRKKFSKGYRLHSNTLGHNTQTNTSCASKQKVIWKSLYVSLSNVHVCIRLKKYEHLALQFTEKLYFDSLLHFMHSYPILLSYHTIFWYITLNTLMIMNMNINLQHVNDSPSS